MQKFRLSLATAALCMLPAGAAAQVVTATFFGTVVDPNGAVITGASVTVLNVDRGSTSMHIADTLGEVTFSSLPIGEYAITAEAKGFKTLKRTGVHLSAGQDLRMTLSLEIGQLTETIEVKGESPLVNTANAEQRSNLEASSVQELADGASRLDQSPEPEHGSAGLRRVGSPERPCAQFLPADRGRNGRHTGQRTALFLDERQLQLHQRCQHRGHCRGERCQGHRLGGDRQHHLRQREYHHQIAAPTIFTEACSG